MCSAIWQGERHAKILSTAHTGGMDGTERHAVIAVSIALKSGSAKDENEKQ